MSSISGEDHSAIRHILEDKINISLYKSFSELDYSDFSKMAHFFLEYLNDENDENDENYDSFISTFLQTAIFIDESYTDNMDIVLNDTFQEMLRDQLEELTLDESTIEHNILKDRLDMDDGEGDIYFGSNSEEAKNTQIQSNINEIASFIEDLVDIISNYCIEQNAFNEHKLKPNCI